jgi:hypothetical protein
MKKTKITVIWEQQRVGSLWQLGSFQRTLTLATGITQGADKYSTQNPTSSNVNSENDVTANLPSPHLSQKGLWESVQSGRPIQSHCTANMEPKDRIHRARSAAQKIPPPVSLTFNDQTSASITNLNSIYPDIVLNTQSLVEDGSAMASEQVAKSPHTREVRDIQDIGRSMGDMESCEDMKSGVEQRITESGGVESSDTPVDPIHHASPQLDESNFALSNQSLRISSLLPPPPAVVIPAPFHGLSALLEGTATRQHNDDGPAADRSVLQAEYGSPTQIPVEEDDCHSVTSDDDNDSDYLEDVETGALDAEERLPPSKRHKRNHSLEANLPKCLGSDLSPSARFSSQHDHSRELASKSHSLESKPIPVQGFLTLQNCGSDIIYCLKFSQTHFASFFADDQTREARRKTRRTRNSVRRVRFSQEEDALIVQLKEKMNLMWDEIEDRFAEQFSYRSKSSLQGHYSTRLKQPSRQ